MAKTPRKAKSAKAKKSNGGVMIQMSDVSKWYGDFQVLSNCTTSVNKGEVVVV